MARRNDIDWDLIEREYRLGQKSTLQIATEYGVDNSGIGKRAKKYGWVQDKAKDVDVARESLLIQAASGASNPNSTPTPLEVKAAAQAGADVILEHRKGLRRQKAVAEKLLGMVEAAIDSIPEMHRLIELAKKSNLDDEDKRVLMESIRKLISRSGLIKDFGEVVVFSERVRKGEREAYGLDKQDAQKSPVEELLAKIGRL